MPNLEKGGALQFRVKDLGLRVKDFRVKDLGFRVLPSTLTEVLQNTPLLHPI